MGARIETAKGFVDHYIECSINPDSFLSKVSRLVDWRPFELHLAKWQKERSGGGWSAYVS